ncbi:glutamine-tRNA ligase [Pneumocystis murina B123]|uniref:glutamine--tRNA ligase n=1 Tax=Pneumocystis murina (strain B123) TaxID=1069680 RepID=M7PK68_PNEMU|nr:glutamine-tRNA ligase [Pneumocystis murina B123]EMR10839.1 glutamine-tRNA ligase [Pneumocystis murina B123]
MIESMEKAFRAIGLSDLKIKETLKNDKLSYILFENVMHTDILNSGCTKIQGNLLYILSTHGGSLGEYGRSYICDAIMLNKLQTTLQVKTAISYLMDCNCVFDSDSFDKACGVGVIMNEEDILSEVQAYINENKERICSIGIKKVGAVLSTLRQVPALKWADPLILKNLVENELSNLDLHSKKEEHIVREEALNYSFTSKNEKLTQNTLEAVNDAPNMFEEGFLAKLHKPGENKQIHQRLMEEHLKHTKGKVVTRFPPEPNGYLHIGHSKAIAINFGFAKYHGGYCYLRYDDTNPEAEEDVFVQSIEDTVKWLGFEPYAITFSSDYFDELYRLAVLLIEKGKAYVCHCSDAEIKYGRGGDEHGQRIACKHRDRPISENLEGFDHMKNGLYKVSEAVLRMKQDLEDGNPQMWDLVAYRILDSPHHRTGTKWRIYPTYDFTHCLVDSLENISHSLCTTEFIGCRRSYDWLCDALEVYRPQQSERRGVPPGAILSFINELGVTTAVATIQVVRFENSVRKFLENITPRLMMIFDPILVVIENLPFDYYEMLEVPYKPDDPTFGTHYLPFTSRIYIDRSDFRIEDSPNYYRLAPGKSVGLLKVPFPIKVTSYTLDPISGLVSELKATYEIHENFKKPKAYIHWIAKTNDADSPIYIDEVRIFKPLFKSDNPSSASLEDFLADVNKDSEYIIKNALIETGFRQLKETLLKNDKNLSQGFNFESLRFQAIRIGYFCMDKDSTSDKIIFNQIVSLKEDKGK